MLTVRDLSNPNLLNKRSDIRLRGSLYLKDIDLSVFSSAIHEYTNIVDDEDRIIGAVKTERLIYMIAKQKEHSFIPILDSISPHSLESTVLKL